MAGLYPLKFEPIFHEKIWGGNRLKAVLNKQNAMPFCGESWEISGVEDNITIVKNGFLKGNNLNELIEVYMGDLVGEKVYEKFGTEFPLLIKFIDAKADLSVQVHPNDKLSAERHNAFGKTEMWYVVDAEKGAKINSGFNQPVTREKYTDYLKTGKLSELLHYDVVEPGDVFFIPAGRVHAIGKGTMVAEIQQTSDVTYRIYDYDRKDKNGNKRELHTELALDAIDYSWQKEYKTRYTTHPNQSTEIVSCPYFTTNILEFDKGIEKDYFALDSFVIYITLEGDFSVKADDNTIEVVSGETVLMPATSNMVYLEPRSESVKLLEVYIK
ncbi:MAG: mannose-6-phosphate isomerase [Draconibacterium sp.]|nr:MAG: mannose-6-phosphate isomerase [Draconibacterium sp.]